MTVTQHDWVLGFLVSTDGFGGQGNSFHGRGGRGSKRAQMRHCLRLMRSVVSTEDEVVLQDMSDQGAINQLLGMSAVLLLECDGQIHASSCCRHFVIPLLIASFVSFLYIMLGFVHNIITVLLSRCWVVCPLSCFFTILARFMQHHVVVILLFGC